MGVISRASGIAELVDHGQRVLAHHHDDLGLHDRQLLDQPADAAGVRHRRIGDRALDAQGPVDRQRIDRQALERLHQRVAGAAVEGDALLDLRGPGRVLDHEDVGLGMAGAEHGHQLPPRAVRAVARCAGERVELTDRALEVLLSDLVVGCRHPTRIGRPACLSLRLHQDLRPVARRTRRSREARAGALGHRLGLQELERLDIEQAGGVADDVGVAQRLRGTPPGRRSRASGCGPSRAPAARGRRSRRPPGSGTWRRTAPPPR